MTSASPFSRWEALAIAAALTAAALALTTCYPVEALWVRLQPQQPVPIVLPDAAEKSWRFPSWVTYGRFTDSLLLLFGLMLALPRPKASGLCLGNIRDHWQKVLVIIGGPLLLTALVYPQLNYRPFAQADATIWLISPAAQDLIFGGTVYRILRPHFSSYIHPRVPIEWVLPVGGLFFAGWHIQNFAYMSAEYVCFQLLYTWAAYTFVGLTRQWTGSLLYVTIAHMTGNFIVWFVK
jgi:hypothetical protein